jgi:hypothetical protein
MPRRLPSLEKLERLTGFRPATPLVEIVDRVALHFQKPTEPSAIVEPNLRPLVAGSNV